MERDSAQPTAGRSQSTSAGPPVEDHGRVVTANTEAAAFYRQAQQATDVLGTLTALRHAVTADPTFVLAIADLDAFTETISGTTSNRQMNWERHHIEVVRTASVGNLGRATDLLREHLASVGCDPVAVRIVIELRRRRRQIDGLDDLDDCLFGCHPDSGARDEPSKLVEPVYPGSTTSGAGTDTGEGSRSALEEPRFSSVGDSNKIGCNKGNAMPAWSYLRQDEDSRLVMPATRGI